ncbi:MAG: transcription antitermination factor NusB [Clostridia bacterium]|nr:transcription antitermination factor NusB [Clostridia bacterium]
MSRKSARENAFKIIYNCALMKEPPHDMCEYFEETTKDEMWAEASMDAKDMEYMKAVVFGAAETKNELNEKIAPLLKKWDVARLPKVSLAILQLAIYEIDNMDDVPDRVAVNEAVELAKAYGEDDTYKFINGVLAEYLKNKK